MQSTTTIGNNVETRHQEVPEGWTEIDVYTPCSSTTPWDYYGMKHWNELSSVLRSAGIECQKLMTSRRIIHPQGSGPGGRVRFGDDMIPGTYRIAVAEIDVDRANLAISDHRAAVRDWLDNGGPMPEACRS